jgi:replicative DNA helicase
LNAAAFRMGQLAREGHVNLADARARLVAAGEAAGMTESEDGISRTLESGLTAGLQKPRQNEPSNSKRPAWASLFVAGGSFILDAPALPPSIWGDGAKQVIWAQGEAFMPVGPQGIGKTTLAQQTALARIGLRSEVLGYPVEPGKRNVLYLAMDRPAQVQRSFARMVTEAQREILDKRLIIWKGPLPEDLVKNPKLLREMCQEADADTLYVDSLKDAAPGLNTPTIAAAYNQARQFVIATDTEMAELHHQRKATKGNPKPKTLDDVCGGMQLTAGAGSVVLLWGEPGDTIVEWSHLKQPAEPVGPFLVQHHHDSGYSTVMAEGETDLVELAISKGAKGITVREAAEKLFHTENPATDQIEAARRRLDRHCKSNDARLKREGGGRGGNNAARYVPLFLIHPGA